MRKSLIISVVALIAAMASCSKTGMLDDACKEVTVNYSVSASDTKAFGEGGAVNYIWYGLYREDGTLAKDFGIRPFVDGKAECPVTMVKDQNYRVAFVGQHWHGDPKTPAYKIDATKALLYMPESAKTNSDDYDLFCAVDEVIDYKGEDGASVVLERIVAQVNFYCTEASWEEAMASGDIPTHSSVVVTGVPQAYCFISGEHSTTGVTVNFEMASMTGEACHLATAYCFAGGRVGAAMTLYSSSAGIVYGKVDAGAVTMEGNKRTNIVCEPLIFKY